MWDALLWLYLVNAALLVTHEIDSAYWQEWNLFRLPGGIALFLALHLPLVFLILYGLLFVHQRTTAGLVFSFILAAGGVFAFVIHMYFIKKGREEFRTPMSLFILAAALIVSLAQAAAVLFSL